MGDPAPFQEAIQRAKQLAAKITKNAPVPKRPMTGGPSDLSGPVKVTLAYEKPANHNHNLDNETSSSSSSMKPDRRRSPSRDYNRNERDSRDYKGSEMRNDNNNQRDSNLAPSRSNLSSGYNSQSQHDNFAPTQTTTPLLPSQSTHQSGPPNTRSSEEKIDLIIPHSVIGLVIGKGGENIKRIQNESGATVRVDPNTIDEKGNKLCTITGTKQAVDEAHAQVANVIENAAQNKRPRLGGNNDSSSDAYRMKIPAHRTGAIIGKGGETIKGIKQQSGCEIELDKQAKECGPDESLFIIRGSQDNIQKARSLIEQRLARGARDGPGGGGGGSGGGGGGRDHHSGGGGGGSGGGGDGGHGRRGRGGVATGANAAPVAQFTDLPTPFAAQPGQQNSADMTAAWAAYMAQYSSMFNQPGAQPNAGGGAPTAAAAMAYGAAPAGMMGAPAATTTPMLPTMAPNASGQQQAPLAVDPSQQQQANMGGGGGGAPVAGANPSQDYTDQWIEFYLANGRPDYAEQMIQLRKQQQAGMTK